MMTTKGKIIDVKLGFLEPGFELKLCCVEVITYLGKSLFFLELVLAVIVNMVGLTTQSSLHRIFKNLGRR